MAKGQDTWLESQDEVMVFLQAYFEVIELNVKDYVEIASIKAKGDNLLSTSRDPNQSSRKLSLVDSSVIHVAIKHKAPVITGDKDLQYVAKKLDIQVLW